MRKRVGIIGHFGGSEQFCDGQTVKTKELASLLKEKGGFSVVCADTYYKRHNKINLLLQILVCLTACKDIFLLVAENGMKFFLPFLYYFQKIKKVRVYHYIIGSEILEFVQENPGLVKYLNSFQKNWFEYESGTLFLREKGIKNAETLANFKLLQPVKEAKDYVKNAEVYRFCTFSRVTHEKGITDAICAVREINEQYGKTIAQLDIYGPVENSYKCEFEKLLNETPETIAYKGVIENHQSVDTIKEYFAVLFPTKWRGEGVAGTIIDAFASGVPVIASDWRANSEMICSCKTGILYPSEEYTTLKEAMLWAINNEANMNGMRAACRKEFDKYMPEAILERILEEMKKHAVNR